MTSEIFELVNYFGPSLRQTAAPKARRHQGDQQEAAVGNIWE